MNIVKILRSMVGGAVPAPSQMQEGQLAVNLADRVLYSKDSAGTVKQIGAKPGANSDITSLSALTALSVTGTITAGSFTGPGTGLTGTAAGLTAGNTSNLAGGAANQIAYQSAPGVTAFAPAPGSGTYLTWNGTSYVWSVPVATGQASGGVNSDVFWEANNTVNLSYTLTTGKNAVTPGNIAVVTGVTAKVPTGQRWVIV